MSRKDYFQFGKRFFKFRRAKGELVTIIVVHITFDNFLNWCISIFGGLEPSLKELMNQQIQLPQQLIVLQMLNLGILQLLPGIVPQFISKCFRVSSVKQSSLWVKIHLTSRVQRVLGVVQSHGDYNRLAIGVFENYLNMKLVDSSMNGVSNSIFLISLFFPIIPPVFYTMLPYSKPYKCLRNVFRL